LVQSDARALRTVLSLTGVKEGLRGHIVVELSDLDNEVLVKLVGGDLVETVVAHDVIGRLMIQCARQPGLAQVIIYYHFMVFSSCIIHNLNPVQEKPQLLVSSYLILNKNNYMIVCLFVCMVYY